VPGSGGQSYGEWGPLRHLLDFVGLRMGAAVTNGCVRTDHVQIPIVDLPSVGNGIGVAAYQGECCTTELRRPAGLEFIGSLVDVDDALRRDRPC
jgi:hypothetical protein